MRKAVAKPKPKAKPKAAAKPKPKAKPKPAAKPKPVAKAKPAAKAVQVMLSGEKWGVVREGNKRPTATFDTQKAAWEAAMKTAKKEKAKAVKMGKDGKVKETRNFGA